MVIRRRNDNQIRARSVGLRKLLATTYITHGAPHFAATAQTLHINESDDFQVPCRDIIGALRDERPDESM